MKESALITARLCLIVIVLLLLFATAADIGSIIFGGLFTADTYYMPLRNIDIGDSRDAVEASIIETHTDTLTSKHTMLLVIHALALASALIALSRIKSAKQLSKAQ